MHILLVEDDKHTADYASRGFKEAGRRSLTVFEPQEIKPLLFF